MESSLLDFGYAIGERDVLQGLAAEKRSFADFGNAVWYNNVFFIAQILDKHTVLYVEWIATCDAAIIVRRLNAVDGELRGQLYFFEV